MNGLGNVLIRRFVCLLLFVGFAFTQMTDNGTYYVMQNPILFYCAVIAIAVVIIMLSTVHSQDAS